MRTSSFKRVLLLRRCRRCSIVRSRNGCSKLPINRMAAKLRAGRGQVRRRWRRKPVPPLHLSRWSVRSHVTSIWHPISPWRAQQDVEPGRTGQRTMAVVQGSTRAGSLAAPPRVGNDDHNQRSPTRHETRQGSTASFQDAMATARSVQQLRRRARSRHAQQLIAQMLHAISVRMKWSRLRTVQQE